jgi:hypothetical protein
MLPDFDRAYRIGELWNYPESRALRAADRLRGGPDAPGGPRRHFAGVRPLTRRGASALEGRRPIIDLGHGRRLLAFQRTRMAQRPIACNAADPYHLGDEPYPPKGALSRGGSAHGHSLPSVPDRVRRRRRGLHLPHRPRGGGRSLPLGRRAGRVGVALPNGHDNVRYADAHGPIHRISIISGASASPRAPVG